MVRTYNIADEEGQVMLEFLSEKYISALSFLNDRFIYELRLRAGKPVIVNYKGDYAYLCERGISRAEQGALVSTSSELEEIIYRASEYSVYSVTEQLRQGFLTGSMGERIGLAGAFVYEDGKTFTVREITSLNIRIPHEIIGCADIVYRECLQERLQNVLIFSAPGRGKTTILRDLSRLICQKNIVNVLINDERNEIAAAYRDFTLNIGAFCDIVRYSYKRDALTAAVRAMRPDVIVTDEIAGEEDIAAVADCSRSGVFVIASAHMRDIGCIKTSETFRLLVEERIFDRYVALSYDEIGKVSAIYDAELDCVYRG